MQRNLSEFSCFFRATREVALHVPKTHSYIKFSGKKIKNKNQPLMKTTNLSEYLVRHMDLQILEARMKHYIFYKLSCIHLLNNF